MISIKNNRIPESETHFIRSKRGISHLEVIISFLIFIIFLTLLFIIIRPTKIPNEKVFLVKGLEEKIPKSAGNNLIVSSIANSSDLGNDTNKAPYNCFSIPNIPDGNGLKVIVKNVKGEKVNAHFDSSNNKLYIQSSGGFFSVYYANNLNELPLTVSEGNCKDLSNSDSDISNDYIIGNTKILKFMFQSELEKIRDQINNPASYKNLKNSYGFPDGNDFAFILKDTSIPQQQIVVSKIYNQKGSQTEIYAEDFPVNYIDKDANINPGWLNIQAW